MVLRDKDRAITLRIAQQTLSDSVAVWAYGSRVNGTAHESSDLDLVLRNGKREKRQYRRMGKF